MSEVIEYKLIGLKYAYRTENLNKWYHSYYDEPACIGIFYEECYIYSNDGYWHRDDAPAIIRCSNDDKFDKFDKFEWYNRGIRYKPVCQKL